MILAISCQNNPDPTLQFNRQDIVGEWTMVQVAYSGEMPNPLNPSSLLQFSGLGTSF